MYKKALEEKSEEIESKNEIINQMMEERMASGEDLGLDAIDVGQLLDVNLGAATIRDLLEDKALLTCDLLDSPGREVKSSDFKADIELSAGRPGVVGRLKVQKMEKIESLSRQNQDDGEMECNAKKEEYGMKNGHPMERSRGKSEKSRVVDEEQDKRNHPIKSREQQRCRGRQASFQKQINMHPIALTHSNENSFNGSPATSSSESSPTPPVKNLKCLTSPPLQDAGTKKQKTREKSSASSNSSFSTPPQPNRLKIGVMSTRMGTIKKYSSNASHPDSSVYNSASKVSLQSKAFGDVDMQTTATSFTSMTPTTVLCPHCPKQFPRGGAWKIPQHISLHHPSASPHLMPSSSISKEGLPPFPTQHKSSSSLQQGQESASSPSPALSKKCNQCGEELPYPSTQVAHRCSKLIFQRKNATQHSLQGSPLSPPSLEVHQLQTTSSLAPYLP